MEANPALQGPNARRRIRHPNRGNGETGERALGGSAEAPRDGGTRHDARLSRCGQCRAIRGDQGDGSRGYAADAAGGTDRGNGGTDRGEPRGGYANREDIAENGWRNWRNGEGDVGGSVSRNETPGVSLSACRESANHWTRLGETPMCSRNTIPSRNEQIRRPSAEDLQQNRGKHFIPPENVGLAGKDER